METPGNPEQENVQQTKSNMQLFCNDIELHREIEDQKDNQTQKTPIPQSSVEQLPLPPQKRVSKIPTISSATETFTVNSLSSEPVAPSRLTNNTENRVDAVK